MGKIKSWHRNTQEEIDFIVDNWKTMSYPEMSSRLGMTTKAISTLVYLLKKRGKIDKGHWANRSTKNDLTNKRFGSVIAQKYLYTNHEGRAVWLCLCDCGKSAEIGTHNLKRNRIISCGCVEEKRAIDRIVRVAYKNHLKGAKDRGYASYLSIEEYVKVASSPCVYCGKLCVRKNPDTGHQINLNSVDRINNEPHYKIGNTQATCFTCQRMKSDMKHEEFLDHVLGIQVKK